jgi:CheY-like chemotaxis protein
MFILLVDDDFDDCELFTEIVREIDSSNLVVSRHNGIEALKFLNDEVNPLPDMIFLDINMPKMNGKQLFAMLRKDEKVSHIPVIIYSTSIPEKEVDYFASHGVICLVKPSTYQALKEALVNIIQPEVKI